MTTEIMLPIWRMGRTRLTNQLPSISSESLPLRIHPDSNSIGWLLRHIAEVELLFAKNVFGRPLQVKLSTVGQGIKDLGHFTNLEELKGLLDESGRELEAAILDQEDGSWSTEVTTREFGTITKAEALSRITTHTAWHAGQIAIIKKYAVAG
ncbi:DinB family protein [uncultured Imperialibacter sp.]|uniref:DinB family protein n=1 Tax=uncultured Imperialibacter sp. TaxID=1672639 RepID=UPI0030DCCD4F|tara:strand:+ start:55411 stop:55866 length:456 start_codon:yes stop_codon:yes gene_type:complete